MNILSLAIGGATGAILRYLIGLALMRRYPNPPFPIAMLFVNLVGAFGLGVFFNLYYGSIPLSPYKDPLFLLIGIGFFGSFTTFSTFSVEATQLYMKKEWQKLTAYVVLSIFGSLVCFLGGFSI
ncbi:fluoride efflux transporter CrcB [Bacillus solitudinis]|uniref:fluoride efflux transporter CrcB n=1 Tax=Bacillus solitudinis TaxID=2014074 RepID=UPI000C24D8F5|nr:fluoride efflux transporter CrcB [Bacillus solitudinis]